MDGVETADGQPARLQGSLQPEPRGQRQGALSSPAPTGRTGGLQYPRVLSMTGEFECQLCIQDSDDTGFTPPRVGSEKIAACLDHSTWRMLSWLAQLS